MPLTPSDAYCYVTIRKLVYSIFNILRLSFAGRKSRHSGLLHLPIDERGDA
jgi:hypothetical protein